MYKGAFPNLTQLFLTLAVDLCSKILTLTSDFLSQQRNADSTDLSNWLPVPEKRQYRDFGTTPATLYLKSGFI
jgi:hypothetical protein